MSSTLVRTIVRIATLPAMLALGVLRHAEAGPPLICQPFPTLDAESLPWNVPGKQWDKGNWKSPDPTYDIRSLAADTVRLLAPETPVLARMETMRRATIYASTDAAVARDLLARVLARAVSARAEGRADTQAFFDAGYLIESYRQAAVLDDEGRSRQKNKILGVLHASGADADGYAWVERALNAPDATPEMELAAALMSQGARFGEHLSKTARAADEGSVLAALVVRADGRARTLSEVRARLASRH